MQTRKTLLIALAVALLFILPLASSFLGLAVDWLFFAETGFTAVFIRTLSAKIGLGVAFGLFFAVFVLANALIVRKAAFPRRHFHFWEGVPQFST